MLLSASHINILQSARSHCARRTMTRFRECEDDMLTSQAQPAFGREYYDPLESSTVLSSSAPYSQREEKSKLLAKASIL